MLLIFMSEHMFRSRDQSVKIQREFFRYASMALCFFYPHSVPIPHCCGPFESEYSKTPQD